MAATLDNRALAREWGPVLAGGAALFIPTYLQLAGGLWDMDAYAHGPIVLAVTLFLLWQKREVFRQVGMSQATVAGSANLVLGLLLYVLGRSQGIVLFEVGAQIPLVIGCLLLLRGWNTVRWLWFPLFFMLFLVPIPGFMLDAVTVPLKGYLASIVEVLVYQLGYPIARTGVTLSVGQYRLLVADACSGINSMYSLSAMGLLYIYLMHYANRLRNVLLLAAILPLAFAANIARVIILVLVTYYFGDEAGQGFLHEFAGIALFLSGLLLLVGLDALLGLVPALAQKERA